MNILNQFCFTRNIIKENQGVQGEETIRFVQNKKNLDAMYILLAMKTKCHYKDEVYQELKSLSTAKLPLCRVRRAWLSVLIDIHDDCFHKKENHLLPMLSPERNDLENEDKRGLLHMCYEMVSKAIHEEFFCNVGRLFYDSSFIEDVPDVEGNAISLISILS